MPKGLNQETVQVNLQFTADIAQAKKELKQLQETLRSITKDPAEGFSLSKEFAEASRYAAELSVHLKKGINPNTGMLDFSRLNESIKKSGRTLSEYGDKLLTLGPQGRQAFSQLATAVAQSEIPIKRVNGALAQMGTVLKNTLRWQLSSSAIHAFSGAVQTAYNYAKDLNESLNNIRIVTGQNIDQMEKFAVSANKAARSLSASTLDYTNAALIYYQQGLSDEEAQARTDVTVKMANVTRQSAEEVSEQLTAIWNNYAKGADNLEYYADVITALGAATASSSQEISTGLEKFAAIGETVGLSYEYATAALATVTATTRQSAEIVGNAFKTLFARLQGLKLGETDEDGTTLTKYSQALMDVGVNIKNVDGSLKDMDVILDETAARWQGLSKSQQMALAQTVAGVRQYTQFIALMNNWDFMQENLNTAYNSSGELEKQQDIYTQGWEAAAQRVKTAWQEVYHSLVDEDFFIDLLNFIEKNVKGLQNLIQALGGIPGLLTTIGTLFMNIFGKQMAEGLTSLTYSIRSLSSSGRQSMIEERQTELNKMGDAAVTYKIADSKEDTAWADNLQKQMLLQDQLAQNTDKLSDAERYVVQTLSDQVKERSRLVELAAQDIDKANERIELEREAQLEQAKAKKSNLQDQIFYKAWEKFQKNINNNKNVDIGWSSNNHIVEILSADIKKTANNDTLRKNIKESAESILQDYSVALSKSPTGQQLSEKLNSLIIATGKHKTNKNRAEVENLLKEIQDIINKGVNTTGRGAAEQEFVNTGGAAEEAEKQIRALLAAESDFESKQQSLQNALGNTASFIDLASQKTMSWQESFISFAQVASTSGMIFNQLNGIIDTWQNKNLTFGEQLASSLASIGFVLPMILSGFKTLKEMTESIATSQKIFNIHMKAGLSMEKVREGLLGIQKILSQEELSKEEKKNALKILGVSQDKAAVAMRGIQNALAEKGLTNAQKTALVEAGILTIDEAQNVAVAKQIVQQKLLNATIAKNPLILIGAAIIGTLIAIGTILKQNAEQEKENLEKQREADEKALQAATERAQKIKEETDNLQQLTQAIKDSINAYDGSNAKKEEIFETTKNLLDAYNIEGASLLLLQGRYKELNKVIDEYNEKQRQEHIKELQNQLDNTNNYAGIQLKSFTTAYNGLKDGDSALYYWGRQQGYEKLSEEDKKYLSSTLSNGGNFKLQFKDIGNYEDVIGNYNAISHYIDNLIEQGVPRTASDIQKLQEYLNNLEPYYKNIQEQQKILTSEKDLSIGYNILSGKEANINNVKNTIKDLSNAYLETSESIDEANEKALKYLGTQSEWAEAVIKYQAIQEKSKQFGAPSEEKLLQIYNKLTDETEKQIFFRLSFNANQTDEEILEAIRHGSIGVEMELHTGKASSLSEGYNNYKKNMSVQETKDWAEKYGITFGDENSTMGITFNDFMAKTESQQREYLSQKVLEEQNLAYENAKSYIANDKSEDLTKREQLLDKRELLEEQLQRKDLGSTYLQAVQQELDVINNALIEVESQLNTAENTIIEAESRKLLEFTSAFEKVKDLKLGDTISQDDFNNLTDGIDKSVSKYFVHNVDGTWTLVVSQIDLKEGIQEALDNRDKPLSKEEQTSLINTASNYNELIKLQGRNNIESDIAIDKVLTLASKYDDCTDEVKLYQRALKDSGKGSNEANKAYTRLVNSLKHNEFKDLSKSLSSTLKNLDKIKEYEKIDTFKEITKQLKDFYNIASDDTRIDEKWVETHLDWIKKLFNGTKEESDKAANDIKQDIYSIEELTLEALTEIKNGNLDATIKVNIDGENVELEAEAIKDVLDLLDDSDIELLATGKADFSELLAELSKTEVGARAVANLLAELGQSHLNVNVSDNNIKMPGEHLGGGGMKFEWEDEIAAIENALASLDGKEISVTGYVPESGNGGVKTVDSSGGGGGSKAQPYKKEEYRYETQTAKLEDLEKVLNRISKEKDRAFGYERVKLINKEIEALDEEIEAQKELLKQVNEFVEVDKDRLFNGQTDAFSTVLKNAKEATWHNAISIQEMLQQVGSDLPIEFDEHGNLLHQEEIKTALNDWYNIQADIYNASAGAGEDAWTIAQKQHDWAMKAIQQYGETANKLIDEQDKLQDELYQKQDYYAEIITTKIEHRIQLEKNELAMIESKIRTLENNFFKSAEVYALLGNKLTKSMENASKLQSDYNEWMNMKGQISATAFEEGMQQIFDSAGESIEDLLSQWESMSTYYSDVLDKFDSRLKFETRLFDNLVDELEYYSDLLSLTGREKDYDTMLEIIRGEKEVIADRLATNQKTQSVYQEEYDQLKKAYEAATSDEQRDFLRPSLEAAAEKLDEINSKVRDDIKKIAELAKQEFSTTLDKIYYQAEKALTGGLGFDYLSQTMDLASTRAEEYLTKTNQIYETTSLIRKINQDIDRTDNTSAKTRLSNFAKEIQALQEKGELSQYELKDAQARYEILKAQIALEEAQNAKSKVRLQRDSEGNYGYVYTTDRTKINEAEENLAKAQNDRYNLALETQQEYLRKFYETEREANEALRQLDEDFAAGRIESEEEYRRRRQEIVNYYSGILETYEGIHTQAIQVMHETSAEAINDSWTNTFGDENGNGLIGKADEWAKQTTADSIEIDNAFKELTSTLDTYVEPEYKDLTEKIQKATEESENLRSKLIDEFLPQMSDVLSGIRDMTIGWSEYALAVRDAVQALLELQSASGTQINTDFALESSQASNLGDALSLLDSRDVKIEALGIEGEYVDSDRLREVAKAYFNEKDPKHSEAVKIRDAVASGQEFYTDDYLKKHGFKSGGYTGSWTGGSDLYNGKLAMLHEKELVLNQEDTKNMLAAVHLVREITQAIDLQAQSASSGSSISTPTFGSIGNVLEQSVTITAEFPNVTSHSEIEEAFNNLINRASQYANRR